MLSTDQILKGLGLVIVLALASRLVSSRVRLPAIVLLLPVGFAAGAATDGVHPDALFGNAFQPLVSLGVGLILFEAGLRLRLDELRGGTRGVVQRLVVAGPVVTAVGVTLAVKLLFGLGWGVSAVLGAILVVSGPTVVLPLLAFVRPTDRVRSVVKHVLLIAASVLMIYPLLWLIASSFRPNDLIFRTPGLWVNQLYIENYTKGWYALASPFGTYIINSAIVVVGAIAGNLFACTLAAYAFARLRFRLKTLWFAIMLMTIMLPIHVVVVPQYIIFNKLGFVNTFVPLILPKFLATDAFFVFLMVQFIRGIPRELDEAARIDGCGHWRIFTRVMLPLMGPAIATTAIFTFIWTWSDFFTPLIYLTDPIAYTVPVALRSFLDATAGSNWGALFAMSILSLIPLFLAFLFGQRFLVKGIATTGGK